MALKRMVIDGYGQVELNQVAFRRDGRIEAQCALDATDFATVPAENGMLLAVDNITRTVKLPKDASLPLALNYTAEHIYDERTPGLKNFKTEVDDIYPRLGYLSVGDKFVTNCVAYDSNEFTNDEALEEAVANIGTTKLYGGYSTLGAIKVSATKPVDGPVLMVINGPGAGSMPDGQYGIKFQVVAD